MWLRWLKIQQHHRSRQSVTSGAILQDFFPPHSDTSRLASRSKISSPQLSSPLSQPWISLTASSSNRSSALTWTPAALFCHSISTLTLTAIHIRNLNKAHSAGEIRSLHGGFECYFVLKQMHICMFYCCCRLSFSITSLVFRFSISATIDILCLIPFHFPHRSWTLSTHLSSCLWAGPGMLLQTQLWVSWWARVDGPPLAVWCHGRWLSLTVCSEGSSFKVPGAEREAREVKTWATLTI